MEADTGDFVSQPSACCISSSLVNCKCVGINKQSKPEKHYNSYAQERGGEWEKPSVVSKLGGWPHAFFTTSTPPVAFLWVPKHILVSHIPSVRILCPAMWRGG